MSQPTTQFTANPLRWLPEFLTLSQRRLRTQSRLLGSALLVGVVAGAGAIVFAVACQLVVTYALDAQAGYRAPGPAGEAAVSWLHEGDTPFRPWMLLIVPTIGGLISGVLVFTLAPEAEGHGTDAVIDAYHRKQGRIRPRVPLVKIVASAITIGSGGSGGREGPIAQIGAGFGSFLAGLLKMRSADRRVLMAAGMGAGIAAIFRAPLAGALFASEVLYRSPEFEPEVIMPAALASVVAYCTFGVVFGWQSLFATPKLVFSGPIELIGYLVLALAMVLLAMLYTRSFYGLTHLFHRLPLRPHLRPAVGAFLSGAVGLGLYHLFGQSKDVLAVLSFGYGIVQGALHDQAGLSAAVLLAVALGKILTTGLTIGSGGSGGVFGPSMVIGGCGGGALGMALHALWPPLAPQPAAFVIVGMAGFFAAAAKTPISTLVIVSEMTGDYNLILPALFVCTLAFLLSDEQSLYSAQVESRSLSPAHQGSYVRDVLTGVRVDQFLKSGWDGPVLHADDPLAAIASNFQDGVPVLPVVDADRRLLGVVSLEEAHLAGQVSEARPLLLAADLMRAGITPLRPDDRLDRALELFVENDLLALPVVDRAAGRVVGVVRRSDLVGEYLRRVHGPAPSVSDLLVGP